MKTKLISSKITHKTLYISLYMAKNKLKEKEKRKALYSYEINLLLRGMPVKDVFTLSSTLGNKVSMRTLARLKKEYTDFPCER